MNTKHRKLPHLKRRNLPLFRMLPRNSLATYENHRHTHRWLGIWAFVGLLFYLSAGIAVVTLLAQLYKN